MMLSIPNITTCLDMFKTHAGYGRERATLLMNERQYSLVLDND